MTRTALRDVACMVIASLVIMLVNSGLASENVTPQESIDLPAVKTDFARSWNPSVETGRAYSPAVPSPWVAFSFGEHWRRDSAPLPMYASFDSDVLPIGPPAPRATRGAAPLPEELPENGTSRETPWDDWEDREANWSDWGLGDSPWD